jgi:hypothetical protein
LRNGNNEMFGLATPSHGKASAGEAGSYRIDTPTHLLLERACGVPELVQGI